MASDQKEDFPADPMATDDSTATKNISISSEFLLQTLLNAIQTTNDVIGECNNNYRQHCSPPHDSTSTETSTGTKPLQVDAGGMEKHDLMSSSDIFSDEELTHWQRESSDVRIVESLSDSFLLPPPLEFDSDRVMSDDSDNAVFLPPPDVFESLEESTLFSSGVTGELKRGADVNVDSLGTPDTQELRRAGGDLEEVVGKIVGGMFSVLEVCALFENDQMYVLKGAMDGGDALQEELYLESDEAGSLSFSPGTSVDAIPQQNAVSHITSRIVGRKPADAVTMEMVAKEGNGCSSQVDGSSSKDVSSVNVLSDVGGINDESNVRAAEVKQINDDDGNSPSEIISSTRGKTHYSLSKEATSQELNKPPTAIPDTLSPDPDKKSPDPDKKSPDPPAALLSSGSLAAKWERGQRLDLTTTTLPTAAGGGGGGDGDSGGANSAPGMEDSQSGADARGVVGTDILDSTSDGNIKPEVIVCAQLMPKAAAACIVLNANTGAHRISTDDCSHAKVKLQEENSDRRRVAANGDSGVTQKDKKESNGKSAKTSFTSYEKRQMEAVCFDLSESLKHLERERHFVSRTVKKTMTQETRSSGVGMATEFGARSKVSSTFAGGEAVPKDDEGFNIKVKKEPASKTELNDEPGKDKMALNDEHGKDNVENHQPEKKGGSVDVEKNPGKDGRDKVSGKECSVFDTLLDHKEVKLERNGWSVFERREATRLQTERHDEAMITPTTAVKTPVPVEASGRPEDPPRASGDHLNIPNVQVTERKEEILRLEQPVCLTLPHGKLARHSDPLKESPASAVIASDTSSMATSSQQPTAPLATPEESVVDPMSYPNRSRQSSVGPCRSRQSSVGPCRSRQSSVGSVPGFQLPQSGVSTHFVVVAIDFGTTYSGYAFSFTRDPDSIHMMRRWEGGDPGIVNQKTPTTLLLTSDGKFHSFGFTARDFYHDLDPQEAKKWLYFEKFKMTLHHNADLNKDTTIKASNGKSYAALAVFSHALTFFKDHALQELSDQSSTTILNEDIRWVITVPAIWKAPAKQFMRQAAYQAGIASPDNPNQLLIALEPEAASIYVRKLRLYQLMPEPALSQFAKREPTPDPLGSGRAPDDEFATSNSVKYKTLPSSPSYRHSICPTSTTASVGQEVDIEGTNYMVVDCGGGTVDITVYEMESGCGHLKELHKATGGPYGSLGIDMEFEKMLINIFGSDFIEAFRSKRPAGWVDLLIAFESRKRTASPLKNNPLNVSLPFSFIDYYKKHKGGHVESAIRKYGNKEVTWSSQGMLRLTMTAMRRLFQPTLDHIKQAIGDVLNNPNTRDIRYLFLVGGFAESAILQLELRKEFDHLLKILIPQDVGLTILKGAVCFGLDPTIVSVRRSRLTYGVGVLNRFIPDKHPRSKMITKEGAQWCTDVFDKFVEVDQSVAIGDTVIRSYTPAKAGQKSTIIHVYCCEKPNPEYVTDPGVKRCGTLCLDLTDLQYRHSQKPRRREIQARMTFGDTEIKVTALDVMTGKFVRAAIDFMNK